VASHTPVGLSFPRLITLLSVCVAPVLEIGAILARRGHEVEFATNVGQEGWVKDYPFIKTVHSFGPALPEEKTEAHYARMQKWRPDHGIGPVMASKYLFDSDWPDTYAHLKKLMLSRRRPDFIVADFFADVAARDMLAEFNIQIAVVWPQMPYMMASASYIPGQPGFQVDMTPTSECASIWSRIRNELVLPRALPQLVQYVRWTKRVRSDTGVKSSLPLQSKPDYLVLVNSFFGLEAPRELPPLIHTVGPILSDKYPSLDDSYYDFLNRHDSTVYVALGTHISLAEADLLRILDGLILGLLLGHVDGVIWSIGSKPRARFGKERLVRMHDGAESSIRDLIDGKHPDFIFPHFAPQRAILEHRHTRVYLTHGGASSANEALYHGTPVLTMGFYFDQLGNSARLLEAGVGLSVDKFEFTASEIADKMGRIVRDEDGWFGRNIERMKRIARIASRRKHLAADLIEEVMFDQELRFEKGRELRPMHLQTADMRMPFWKARNWDLYGLSLVSLVAGGASGWWLCCSAWRHWPSILARIVEAARTAAASRGRLR
jgi:UDP:flavonoid glycosyltransferase YjiC (YdhE family)